MAADNKNNNQSPNQNDYVSNITEIPITAIQDDLLNSKYFTDSLIDYIEHADTPFSISLNGEWGSGKTSIINAVKKELCEKENAKFHGVYVNTWQFSLLDSSSAPQAVVRILQSIINQILKLKPDYERKKQISQLMGALATISSGLKSFSDAAGDPLFGVGKSTFGLIEKASNALNKHFNTNTDQSKTDNAALVKQLSGEIQKLVDEVLTAPKSQDGHYEPYNPCLISKIPNYPCAKFVCFIGSCLCNFSIMLVFIVYYLGLLCFNVIFGFIGGIVLSIVKSSRILKALFDFCCYVLGVGCAICCNEEESSKSDKRNGFIFFIDDLDRIDPNMALEIVEMLASVFSFKKCIFILAIDKDVLIKAAKLKLSKRELDVDAIHYSQYLNRFIHISINIPQGLYDIQPLLRRSLINISFFTADELDNSLLNLLDKVVCYSIGKNPRSVKQLINGLSLLDLFKRYTWEKDEKDDDLPWQVETITKTMIFIIQCIKDKYPELCTALSVRPYFKSWDIDFATRCFNISDPHNSENLARQCSASNDWEFALFHICKFDNHSQLEFYKLRQIFDVINDVFRIYLLKQNIKQSEEQVYINIISDVFYYFYRISGGELERGVYQDYVVKTTKEYRRKR